MLTLDEIEEGDEICRYGATTQKVLCSNVVTLNTMISEGTVIADNYASAPGDSGEPVWSPEKGFIGLNKGESARSGCSVTTPILNIVPQKYL